MSLFRTERWVVAICPEQVAVFNPCGKGRAVGADDADGADGAAAHVFPVSPSADAPLWESALTVFEAWLRQSASKRRSLHIVLSNRFARFALVPWSEAIQARAETQMLAQLTLESLYGDMQAWDTALDDGDYGKARLVCALETALLARLRSVVETAGKGVDCRRIEPYFVTCWNRWCGALDQDDAMFSVVEADGHAVLAAFRNGDWHSVRALSGAQDEAALNRLLAREALLQGFDAEPRQWSHRLAPRGDSIDLARPVGGLMPDRMGSSAAVMMAMVGGGA